MEQFTTPEQTAKLIELGFEKPNSEGVRSISDTKVEFYPAYSIGELLEMCPLRIIGEYGIWYYVTVYAYQTYWRVAYSDDNDIPFIDSEAVDLIDALFDMIVKLKEEGVI